jgi:hypothetical protein
MLVAAGSAIDARRLRQEQVEPERTGQEAGRLDAAV